MKFVVPTGVLVDVVSVSVEVVFPPVLVTELGLKEAVTPVGNKDALSGDVHELPFPLKFIVIVYDADEPAITGFGDWVPTVTVLGFASVKVVCAVAPEVRPLALTMNFMSRS